MDANSPDPMEVDADTAEPQQADQAPIALQQPEASAAQEQEGVMAAGAGTATAPAEKEESVAAMVADEDAAPPPPPPRADADNQPAAEGVDGGDNGGSGDEEEEDDAEDSDAESEVYEVSHIVDARTAADGTTEYLIKWRGWGAQHNTWEPREHIMDDELVANFEEKRAAKAAKEVRAGRRQRAEAGWRASDR